MAQQAGDKCVRDKCDSMGWQVVHVGGVPWAGSEGDHGDLCAVPLHGAVFVLLHPKQEQGMAISRQILCWKPDCCHLASFLHP